MKIKFITNLKLEETSGGGSGVNYATYSQLLKNFEVELVEGINPPVNYFQKLKSVILRRLGFKGNYYFFSNKRLKKISNILEKANDSKDGDIYFFHGFTSWINFFPDRPYFAFSDACFKTYVEIYNNKEEFNSRDLKRIYEKERKWLNKAQKVFFRSEWALRETKIAYDLTGDNFVNIGLGGFIDIPRADEYDGSINFLFISREFVPKGGLIVLEAFKRLKSMTSEKELNLWIVGEDPGELISGMGNVKYLGYFNKNNINEYNSLIKIFSKSFALVHPTIKDTNSLVVTELAYFGCPAITSNKFALSEYVIASETGFLLEDPMDPEELLFYMKKLLSNNEMYLKMRIATRINAISNNTWEKVGEKLNSEIKLSLKN